MGGAEGQVRVFQQIRVDVPVQGPRAAHATRTPPGFFDSEERDPVAGFEQPTLQVGSHTVREISVLAADYPLGGPLLNVSCSRHGASCASALELDNSRVVRANVPGLKRHARD